MTAKSTGQERERAAHKRKNRAADDGPLYETPDLKFDGTSGEKHLIAEAMRATAEKPRTMTEADTKRFDPASNRPIHFRVGDKVISINQRVGPDSYAIVRAIDGHNDDTKLWVQWRWGGSKKSSSDAIFNIDEVRLWVPPPRAFKVGDRVRHVTTFSGLGAPEGGIKYYKVLGVLEQRVDRGYEPPKHRTWLWVQQEGFTFVGVPFPPETMVSTSVMHLDDPRNV